MESEFEFPEGPFQANVAPTVIEVACNMSCVIIQLKVSSLPALALGTGLGKTTVVREPVVTVPQDVTPLTLIPTEPEKFSLKSTSAEVVVPVSKTFGLLSIQM